jgi:hypothetical protein
LNAGRGRAAIGAPIGGIEPGAGGGANRLLGGGAKPVVGAGPAPGAIIGGGAAKPPTMLLGGGAKPPACGAICGRGRNEVKPEP